MAEDVKHPPILKRTPYVGSAGNRVIHKTDVFCARARDIRPDDRWYIKEIPQDGNYNLCPYCFGDKRQEAAVQEPAAVSTPKKPSFFRSLFQKKPVAAVEEHPQDDAVDTEKSEATHSESDVDLKTEHQDAQESAKKNVSQKRAASGKTVRKKTVPKKKAAKSVKSKSIAKKTASKKAVSKKTGAKKTAAKKTAAKKASSAKKKVSAKKTAVKRSSIKKASPKKKKK